MEPFALSATVRGKGERSNPPAMMKKLRWPKLAYSDQRCNVYTQQFHGGTGVV
ncbi:Smr/MutS family endonuclease [Vibrio chagasii]|nr:Smr/MutS family endonuclease [Vibrio chagasii]